ncbi:MAG: radical SAM protein [Oscillospiraceae bacterium]|nr:radical SAM protein [Oscillospiraceae bacterium]
MKKKAVIFGAGRMGRRSLPDVQQEFDVVAFADNNSSLYTSSSLQLPVIPPSAISTYLGSNGVVVIATVMRTISEIAQQLAELNLKYVVYFEGAIVDYEPLIQMDLPKLYHSITLKPQRLNIDLSHICNIRCRYCQWQSGESIPMLEKNALISWPVINAIAQQTKDIDSFSTVFLAGPGEPLLHPEWFEMISHILQNSNIKSVTIYTNGMTLTKENADKINRLPCNRVELTLSIDGDSPESSEFWRKGSCYTTIKQNILFAHEVMNKDKVRFSINNTCVLPAKYKHITHYWEIKPFLTSCGDYLRKDFPFASVSSHECYDTIEPVETETICVEDMKTIFLCTKRFHSIAIDIWGNVIGCNCARSERSVLGNILHDNMYDIWRDSELMVARRDAFKAGTPQCRCLDNPKNKKRSILVSKCLPEDTKPAKSQVHYGARTLLG